MADILLKHFKEDPKIDFHLEWAHPLLVRQFDNDAFTPDGAVNPDGTPSLGAAINWTFLGQEYGDKIYIRKGTALEWREVGLTIKDDNLFTGLMRTRVDEATGKPKYDLEACAIDSFTIQAQRSGLVTGTGLNKLDYIETVVYGFTIGSDGKLVLGVRGGSDRIGTVLAVPGGSVSYRDSVHPIRRAVLEEGKEEAAISEDLITSNKLIGVYRHDTVDRSLGNFFVFVTQLNAPSGEIIERHRKSMEDYKRFKAEYGGTDLEKEIHARGLMKELASDPRYARDCWENESLMTIENDPDRLRRLITDIHDNGKGVLPSMYGALALFYLNQFGEREYGVLLKTPAFFGKLRENFF